MSLPITALDHRFPSLVDAQNSPGTCGVEILGRVGVCNSNKLQVGSAMQPVWEPGQLSQSGVLLPGTVPSAAWVGLKQEQGSGTVHRSHRHPALKSGWLRAGHPIQNNRQPTF